MSSDERNDNIFKLLKKNRFGIKFKRRLLLIRPKLQPNAFACKSLSEFLYLDLKEVSARSGSLDI